MKYSRVTQGTIAGVRVDISRTGYTGDLGYEIWVPWDSALKIWDELVKKGKPFDIHAAGMIALDIARIEAGGGFFVGGGKLGKKGVGGFQKKILGGMGMGEGGGLWKKNIGGGGRLWMGE